MSGAVPITGYADRLKAAAQAVKEREEAWKLALRQRDEVIVEAVDHGFPGTAAARNAGISQSHVVRIMARSYDDIRDLVA